MKRIVVFLSVICVALIGLMVVRSRNAGAQLLAVQTEITSLSNRLAETEMKVNHQERMNAALGGNLTNRIDELNKREAELARMRAELGQSQKEIGAARNESAAALVKIQEAKAEIDSLAKQIADLSAENRAKDRLVEEARARSDVARAERGELSQQLADSQQALNQLNYQLNNSDFLRVQLAALEKQRAAATNQHGQAKFDPRLPLELLADGSVRAVPLATNSASKP